MTKKYLFDVLLGNLKFPYNHRMVFLLEEGHFCSLGNVRCSCSFGQNKRYKKNALFFVLRAPTHDSFTSNLQFLCELKHMVHLSKTVCGIFDFPLYLVFIKLYIFVQQKAWAL